MVSQKQIRQAVAVSKLYYLKGRTQAEIARELKLSRPTVSRAIQFARDQRIVQIKIDDPLHDVHSLSHQLKKKYHLSQVIIAEPIDDDPHSILMAIGKATAQLLPTLIHDNDIIGVSWGQTLNAVAKYL